MTKQQLDRRNFLKLAGTTTAGAFLASCIGGSSSPSSTASTKGGITVIPYFTTEDDPNTIAVVNAAAAAFSTKNPSVHIAQIVIGAADRDQRILTGLSVGQDLGIFEIGSVYKDAFVSGNYLYPLDSMINSIGADQFQPGTRVTSGGHDYVFAYGGSPAFTWFREDLVPNAPKTIDDVKAAAAANTGSGHYGLAMALGIPLAFQFGWLPILYANGGDYQDPQGNVIFDSPNVTQAIQDWLALDKYTPPGNSNWQFGDYLSAYWSGRTAMEIFTGRFGNLLAGQAPKLVNKTGATGQPFGPVAADFFRWSYFGIDRKTANPEMALEFLQFLFTGDSGVAFANTAPGTLIPSVKSTRDASVQAKIPFVQQHQDWLQTANSLLPNGYDISGPMGALSTGTLKLYDGPPAPWTPQLGGVNPIDAQMMNKIVLEGMSVKDAQSWAVDQMKGIVKDYKQKNPNWRPSA